MPNYALYSARRKRGLGDYATDARNSALLGGAAGLTPGALLGAGLGLRGGPRNALRGAGKGALLGAGVGGGLGLLTSLLDRYANADPTVLAEGDAQTVSNALADKIRLPGRERPGTVDMGVAERTQPMYRSPDGTLFYTDGTPEGDARALEEFRQYS